MKKHSWFKYGAGGETIEIIVRDSSGTRLEKWRIETDDKNKLRKVFLTIKNKYGINMFIKDEIKDRDLEWIP